jgi:hypothetical protein
MTGCPSGESLDRLSDEPDMPDLADFRRAAALLTHRASASTNDAIAGVRAILQEAADCGRLTRLARAVDTAYLIWIAQLRNDKSRRLVIELIDEMARNHPDPYTRRAANVIQAMRDRDRLRFTALLNEVNADEQGLRLIGSISDIYAHALPELATPTSRTTLQSWTAELARHESS